MSEAGLAERIDANIAQFFSSWNIWTTILALALAVFLIYPVLTGRDPDTHPYLLARQAQVAPIRQSGESAVYRAIDIPHGYPLRAGLGVKDPGTPKWSSGRPGDLRDIWRTAVRGAVNEEGNPTGQRGKILTVLGLEKVVDHNLEDLTLGINVIGQYVKRNNGQSVAVCLSNSVELLSSVFAGSFYGFSTILLPYGLTPDKLNSLLSKVSADHVIAEAGTLDLETMSSSAKSIKNIIWVTRPENRHMDWSEGSPEGFEVSSWQELVQKNQRPTNSEVLPLDKDSQVPPVSIFCPTASGGFDLVKYTSENLISGTAALLATLPRAQKLSPSDSLLPTIPLTDSYTLCWIFAALYSNATLALNSVSGDNIDLAHATSRTSPTVVLASPTTVQAYLSHPNTTLPSGLSKYMTTRTLQQGNLPSKQATTSNTLSHLRVLLIPQSVTTPKSARLSSSTLHSIRTHLKCRIGYALTSPSVAGAIAQTNIFDYRDKGGKVCCVGAPLSSVEVNLAGEEGVMGSRTPRGATLTIKGPAVVGGKTTLEDIHVQIDEDYTLLLL
ncbi:uncharacterized protein Z520_10100 [Fonsecaea multimorphosa CBS 102226]|uniref:AMP-dependent synthetase/ligase domain-containing protein n=1 Tax=Fonsecaea multimorphosa CBS 102226 TaxID=1442371 RepID=A0A0D2JU98_9EURO|nr:uncharacterized protein Z520_10100 [Fonsecaea multimorphosa CBS 102226]KIX94074.1 hypothetical protein Z520_10100 [Fonsecaea multimorphosa CBS 102226]OAL19427.1 hypothetical protein AYO22_09589 [Fonsecaea multimorphosa]